VHEYLPLDACRQIARQRTRAVAGTASGFIDDLWSDAGPAARRVGDGDAADMAPLESARSEIESLIPRDGKRHDRDRIEGHASVILYGAIEESGADVAALDDPGFWRFVSLAYLWNFASWREPAFGPRQAKLDGAPPQGRGYEKYVDGRNFFDCVASRMYLRVKCVGGLAHGDLAGAVARGTDFWRSHILRVKVGEHPSLVRAMVRRQADASTRLDTEPLREFAKQLNRTLVNVVAPMLDDESADRLVGELWERQLT
jgi:hypothetical protein